MDFISYAQNYEDVILWRALRDVEDGFYVDVGAADPEDLSVTRAFYERGWSGINIEPADEHFTKLREARPRDRNLMIAVGRETGVRAFYSVAGSGLSTLDPEIASRHRTAGWQIQETTVPVLTLTEILKDSAPPTIHFLKIDVEGAEAEVLEGLNLQRWRPWIIVIEALEPLSKVSNCGEWEHLLLGHGYGFTYFDGLNRFYIASERSSLTEKLAVPPNFFDEFVRRSEWLIRQRASLLERELAHEKARAESSERTACDKASLVQDLRQRASRLEQELAHAKARVESSERTACDTASLAQDRERLLKTASLETDHLRLALQSEQARTNSLQKALFSKEAEIATMQNMLRSEQSQMNSLVERIARLEAALHAISACRGLGRLR